jgi:large subunit ribosomal protein L18
MVHEHDRRKARERRHARVRARVKGSPERPRLCVFRSVKHIYAQAIDDSSGRTLVCASSTELTKKGQKATGNIATAKMIGALVAERLKEKGLEKVVFDRGGFLYHGRVKAVADAAREAGIKF